MMHEQRDRAESFGARATDYDRRRPSYPDALFNDLLAGTASPRVLDVGCGTGIASRALVARGARVTGVEIDERMAEVARGHGLEIEVAPFESWEPARRRFDLVTAAQAWHWVDPVAGPAKAASVLVPGGRLCGIWNVGRLDDEMATLVQSAYDELAPSVHASSVQLGELARDAMDEWDARWRDAFGAYPQFAAPTSRRYPWTQRYTRDEWLSLLATHSDHAKLETYTRAALFERVGAAIDELGGSLDVYYVTYLIEAERR